MSQLVTGEAVALDLRPAGLPSRLLAGLIDGAIIIAAFIAVGAVFLQVASGTSPAGAAALGLTSAVLVFLGVPVACETLWRGRTPGKAALGLRVVRDDGGPISFRQAFVRGMLGLFVEKPGISLGVVAVVSSLLNSQGKRVGDLLAGTIVLQERVAVTRGPVAVMPPQLVPWAASLDLSSVPQQLFLSIRQFLARSADLTEQARATLGGQLVEAVLAVTTPPPPPGTPGWAVLSAVLAERRRREEQRLGSTTSYAAPLPTPGPPPAARPYPAVTSAPAPITPPPVPDEPPAPGPGGFALPR